jgi:phosphoribosylamine---glycine ligase
MDILLLGSGGREHALAWKIAASPLADRLFCAPGNAGIAKECELVALDLADHAVVIAFCKANKIDLVVVGPEAPLCAGIVDDLTAAGIKAFGPSKAAARLEGSKGFTKDLCQANKIPTAAYERFTAAAPAKAYVRAQGAPIVIKADGLAAGKGVVVATHAAEAHAAIDAMLGERRLGEAGARVVIEECLAGDEASFIVIAGGGHALPLASSQDHKRLLDGDLGPNTGGMGAYSPAPVVAPVVHARIMREIIDPAIRGMTAEGMPYTGFLYAGVMIDASGAPRTLEFNCRLGDPETQPILMRLKSDLVDLVQHALDRTLGRVDAEWDRRAALGVVLAAAGYPGEPRKGDAISGLDRDSDECKVFHAATKRSGGTVTTAGGRVLCVTALGETIRQAQRTAYAAVNAIHFDGMQYRKDIGHRAIAPRKS